jgi:hypothetical protein
MSRLFDNGARQYRTLGQTEAIDRLQTDFNKFMEMC